jgi:AAA family ATP:ADP antiporter
MYFQLSILVKTTFIDPGLVNKFLFNFGLYVQIIACAFGLFGTSFFQRRFGIKASLIAYPLSLGVVVVAYIINPTLTTIFYVMLISKALGYALNQPAKEALYIPTSRSIKYKSKAWMDMFGMRFAKATGSTLNAVVGPVILVAGSFALGLIVLWVFIASIIGRTFNNAVANNELIE